MTRRLCFTVDVDRDVNECVPNRTEAVSLHSDDARFTSSEAGVNIILDMMNDIGINGTFFTEATTLRNIDVQFGKNEVAMHGLDHEDMTGEVSGIRLSDDTLNNIMRTSSDIIKDRTGTAPKGFRAPYMRTDERIMNAAAGAGAVYDSSLYGVIGGTFGPYDLGNGMKEILVPTGTDRNGKKITAYLWPMHENKRTYDEYTEMAGTLNDGVFVIATHSWHIVESRSDGMMNSGQRKRNADNVRKIITDLLDSGFKAARMIDVI
ncbi:MAG: polysaccharide deacetylase family protein [Methanomassiliicoccaceae archaeon]|jgi:peptidoglycan/xylan/chitin deacetylase (PgdA/CDA1 family)|nr:polysaccharide deacetylase family protein [Methanomassiliicoccaceae archaeon]